MRDIVFHFVSQILFLPFPIFPNFKAYNLKLCFIVNLSEEFPFKTYQCVWALKKKKKPLIFFFCFKAVHLNHSKQYIMKASNQAAKLKRGMNLPEK